MTAADEIPAPALSVPLEQPVSGEKLIRRQILEQARRNGDDLASIKTSLDRMEARLDSVERSLDGLSEGMRALAGEVEGLAVTLPSVVRDVIREVLQERIHS